MSGEAALLSFSPSDILVDRTRLSAMPICPISQHSLVWLNLLALIKFYSSPAQLPSVIGLQNTGERRSFPIIFWFTGSLKSISPTKYRPSPPDQAPRCNEL